MCLAETNSYIKGAINNQYLPYEENIILYFLNPTFRMS